MTTTASSSDPGDGAGRAASQPSVASGEGGAATSGTGVLPRGVALAIAASAYAVPLLLSRSTTPSPDHPRVLLWYKTLRQPAFKPPDIAIPIAWSAIETALAGAAYRLLRKPSGPARNRALAWLAVNITAIGAWSRLFFGGRSLPVSTVAAAAMIGTGAAYVAEARRVDAPAAAAGVPLVLWVGFATVLTAAIWRLNRHR